MAYELTVAACILVITWLSVTAHVDVSATSFNTTADGNVTQDLSSTNTCPKVCTCEEATRTVRCRGSSLSNISLEGISFDVRNLDLQSNAIINLDSLPLASLSSLQSLDLSHNGITHLTENTFKALVSLEELNLADNKLEVTDLSWLTVTPNIRSVDLRNNNLSQVAITAVNSSNSTVPTLRRLNVSFNQLTTLPVELLRFCPDLLLLDVSFNQLSGLEFITAAPIDHPLQSLFLQNNAISGAISKHTFQPFSGLQFLNVSHNDISELHPQWLGSSPQLKSLEITNNPLATISNHAFAGASKMRELTLKFLSNLTFIGELTFSGLTNITKLIITNNPNLEFIHPSSFADLSSLSVLDLSNNSLSLLIPLTFHNSSVLSSITMSGNPWLCDCEAHSLLNNSKLLYASQVECFYPVELRGENLVNISGGNFICDAPKILNVTEVSKVPIGSSLVLDCPVIGNPRPKVVWITNRGVKLEHDPSMVDYSQLDPEHQHYHTGHEWHAEAKYYDESQLHSSRIHILTNGSLFIDYMTRKDGGYFHCQVCNEYGNDTATVHVLLDYSLIYQVKIKSILFGLVCAVAFFSVTVVISAIRFCSFFFSEAERKKRKSIGEVLELINDYKSDKFDKLSAYKTAKIDQLAAYKTAKMGQLTAYKSAKINRIRTYKQVTVTNIYHHLQNLREHYHSQVARIKDNCAQQVDKLHENYTARVDKLKDYKSHQTEKIRDHYHAQAERVRDYSSQQMHRLRDQYKLQQQHFMKLLELLDMGNCMTVIEAECIRTETMNLDQDINFEIVDRHLHYDSGDSEYVTAGSNSDCSSAASVPYTLSGTPTKAPEEKTTESFPKKRKKKKKPKNDLRESGDDNDDDHQNTGSHSNTDSSEDSPQLVSATVTIEGERDHPDTLLNLDETVISLEPGDTVAKETFV